MHSWSETIPSAAPRNDTDQPRLGSVMTELASPPRTSGPTPEGATGPNSGKTTPSGTTSSPRTHRRRVGWLTAGILVALLAATTLSVILGTLRLDPLAALEAII